MVYLIFCNIELSCIYTAPGKYEWSPVGRGFHSNETLLKVVRGVSPLKGPSPVPISHHGVVLLMV